MIGAFVRTCVNAVQVQHLCDVSGSDSLRLVRFIGSGRVVFPRPFFFSVIRVVRLFGVLGGAESVESLWTILICALSRFRVQGLD